MSGAESTRTPERRHVMHVQDTARRVAEELVLAAAGWGDRLPKHFGRDLDAAIARGTTLRAEHHRSRYVVGLAEYALGWFCARTDQAHVVQSRVGPGPGDRKRHHRVDVRVYVPGDAPVPADALALVGAATASGFRHSSRGPAWKPIELDWEAARRARPRPAGIPTLCGWQVTFPSVPAAGLPGLYAVIAGAFVTRANTALMRDVIES